MGEMAYAPPPEHAHDAPTFAADGSVWRCGCGALLVAEHPWRNVFSASWRPLTRREHRRFRKRDA